ncbi:Lsr2 family DNA-binding protein [Arthrobacter sp. RAF14]|uniref:Lsr2 family DNA-binding protein n=1 Tax=Arthrobacter sp. RAF14 TaxID=3233051 RepID=UPI003F8FC329
MTVKRSANRPRPNKPDLDRIREWASANGYTVAQRGRIAQKVIEEYDAAQA